MKTKRPWKSETLCGAALCGAIFVVSCGPAASVPEVVKAPIPPSIAAKSEASPVSVAAPMAVTDPDRGKTLYLSKCAKCHAFEKPADYEVTEWRDEIMPVMARKARLDPADSAAVLAYILAARSKG
jgi:mono/diheme cytochrome c family protein